MSEKNGDGVLVEVNNLKKHFPIRRGVLRRQVGAVQAVDGITFDIHRGETLALVGESGCGKSTAAHTILQLHKPTAGKVMIAGQDLTRLNKKEIRKARRNMQMIFQDPYTALNPRLTVGNIIGEPLQIHNLGSSTSRKERVQELLKLVGLNPYYISRYPHEFSGAQRQRIGIARALATTPNFVVIDEPTLSLDIAIQTQVVHLLHDLKTQLGLTYLFITRDLSIVRDISDRVAIMYLGRIVELSSRNEIYERPLHPYTQALLSAIPISDPDKEMQRRPLALQGDAPNPAAPPAACRFHPRCPYATEICREVDPEFRDLGTAKIPHWVACHHAESFLYK